MCKIPFIIYSSLFLYSLVFFIFLKPYRTMAYPFSKSLWYAIANFKKDETVEWWRRVKTDVSNFHSYWAKLFLDFLWGEVMVVFTMCRKVVLSISVEEGEKGWSKEESKGWCLFLTIIWSILLIIFYFVLYIMIIIILFILLKHSLFFFIPLSLILPSFLTLLTLFICCNFCLYIFNQNSFLL